MQDASLLHSPFILVIFGATGDLANNKLIPALFSLFKKNHLPSDFFIIGFARRRISDQEFADLFTSVKKDSKWEDFKKHLQYQQGTFEDEKGYLELDKKLRHIDESMGACIQRLFYLATPPTNYEMILHNLELTKLSEGCGYETSEKHEGKNWTKLIIEKPFGKDLETAKLLDARLSSIFDERQIFRVDHYLGKDTVQNIITFRFANSMFEPIWNHTYIDHVQITLSEKSDVSKRGAFFDGVGNLRDVGQNHLMQLVAAVAMEQPRSFLKEDVRDARAHAISALRCLGEEDVRTSVVRGQYQGYLQEKDVHPNSQTETFFAAKLYVDTKRFHGTPFYVRAGKKMKKDEVSISIVFKQTCHILFKEYGCPEVGNVLTFRIQPNEGISMRVISKRPGAKVALGSVDMKFHYEEAYGEKGVDAYQKLLLDIFSGDQMLFNRSDELESSWAFITSILSRWATQEKDNAIGETAPLLPQYTPTTMGPKDSDQLIEKDGRKWM